MAVVACGPSARNEGDGDGGGSGSIDADPTAIDAPQQSEVDAGNAYPDAEPYADGGSCTEWMCENPVEDGCGGPDLCGNGTDEDCDGMPDDGCTCQSGAVQACFQGPPGKRGVGSCVDGMQTCQGTDEFTFWGPCTGGIQPTDDACDTQDNNCNGCADDNPACCVVNLSCPGPGDMPDGSPFVDYVIDGTMFFSGAVTSWSWEVTGGPCDQLFVANGQNPSYTLAGINTSQLTFHPTLSGDYTVHVTITAADGTIYECTFIIHIAGPGLRVELCWDTAGAADIDLHVHRPGTTTRWFELPNGTTNGDDCYYMNCKATQYSGAADWGYASSPLAECVGGPDGADWADNTPAVCRNPRLDVDNISEESTPENMNVDIPQNNGTYRVMVHYYGAFPGQPVTHPLVNIYCGGYLQGTYGQAPDVLNGFDHGDGFDSGLMWRVVDVTTLVSGVDTTGCTLNPLHPPGQTTGYWLTNNDSSY